MDQITGRPIQNHMNPEVEAQSQARRHENNTLFPLCNLKQDSDEDHDWPRVPVGYMTMKYCRDMFNDKVVHNIPYPQQGQELEKFDMPFAQIVNMMRVCPVQLKELYQSNEVDAAVGETISNILIYSLVPQKFKPASYHLPYYLKDDTYYQWKNANEAHRANKAPGCWDKNNLRMKPKKPIRCEGCHNRTPGLNNQDSSRTVVRKLESPVHQFMYVPTVVHHDQDGPQFPVHYVLPSASLRYNQPRK